MDPKNAARDYLLNAERYIKDSLFDEAQREVKKAQEIDPSNIYTFAFLERIEFFRQQKAKENNEQPQSTPSNGVPDDTTHEDTTQQQDDYQTESSENADNSNELTKNDNFPEEQPSYNESPPEHTEITEEPDVEGNVAELSDTLSESVEDDSTEYDENQDQIIDEDTKEDNTIDTMQRDDNNFDFNLRDLEQDTPRQENDQEHSEPQAQDVDNDESSIADTDQPGSDEPAVAKKIDELEKRLQFLTDLVEESGANSNLSLIAEKFGQLEEQISNFQKSLEDRQAKFEANNSESPRLQELEEQLSSITGDLVNLQQSVQQENTGTDNDELVSKISELERQLNELQTSKEEQNNSDVNENTRNKIEQIERRMNDLSISIQADQAEGRNFDRIETLIDNLQSRVEQIASTFTTDAEINKKHSEIHGKFDEIEERLRTFEIKVKELPEQHPPDTTNYESTLEQLHTRLNEIENSIRTEGNIDSVADELRSQMFELESKLQSFRESNQEHDSNPAMQKAIEEQLSNLKEEIEKTQGHISDFEQRLQNISDELREKSTNAELPENLQAQIDELKTRIDQLIELPSRLNELSDTDQQLLANYADLEQRLQEFIGSFETKYVTQEKFSEFEEVLKDMRIRIEELSRSENREQELQKSQNEILSLYTDLEQRVNDIIKNKNDIKGRLSSTENRIKDIGGKFESRLNELTHNLNSLKQEIEVTTKSRIDKGEIDSRFDRVESTILKLSENIEQEKGARYKVNDVSNSIDTIYQQIEEILETLHFEKELRKKQSDLEGKVSDLSLQIETLSGSLDALHQDRQNYKEVENKLQALQEKYDNEQRVSQSKLDEMTQLVEQLKRNFEAEQQERKETKQKQIETGVKHYRTALEKAWQRGAPTGEQESELQNLAELFSIPESTKNEMVREIKLDMYGRAVKKAIAEHKVSRKEALSLEKLRKQYNISLEEYMEYESRFLNDLVSTQFQGTVLLVSSDETNRNDIADRLKSVGFAVVTTQSPKAALEKLEVINPQVILSETEFPGSKHSGMNLLNVLRRNIKFNYIPFIMFAEYNQLDEIENEFTKPNEEVVKKPVDFYQLMTVINDQLKKLRDHLSSQTL